MQPQETWVSLAAGAGHTGRGGNEVVLRAKRGDKRFGATLREHPSLSAGSGMGHWREHARGEHVLLAWMAMGDGKFG